MEELCEYKDVERKRLILSMVITGIVMVVEVIGGIITNSLALLSDAGHMFTHFFALLMSFVAIKIATKLPCHHRTFGLYRAEIIAALFNSLFLFGVTGYIFYESILRILQPEPILAFEMLIVAIIGLIVNIITVAILHESSHEDLNIKGAYVHMIGDTASSVAIIIGVIILIFTEWYIIDPLLAIGIGVVIMIWAFRLFSDSIKILLEYAPKGITIDDVSTALKKEISEIEEIYDMHIWVITSNMYTFTARIALNNTKYENFGNILSRIKEFLNDRYGIIHTTIEFEF
ncbi:MAG: cation transporter [Candidatus Helarchaeota archaeon]|nr:cation transporter [Candidatus Helarchaeota archaeon]